MTNGQLLFYGGAALLTLTVILAIIFIIKKPKYISKSTAYDSIDTGTTQKLLNGYPTDRMTIRRDSPQLSTLTTEETELLPSDQTELISKTGTLNTEQIEL